MLHRCCGLTLIELIIAVALVAIVSAVGVPALQRINDSNRLATRANNFLRTIEYARFTAIKRGLKVYVCGLGPSGNCADHKGLWRHGWLIFINFDGRSPPHLNQGDQLLSEDQALKPEATVYSNRRYFEFTPQGTAINGTVTVCPQSNDVPARTIVISNTGRIRTTQLSHKLSRSEC